LHGSRFDIGSGAVLSLPAYEPIAVYPVRVEGEDVLVEL
jgi:3-phenylpropionate/trans-cinnamate dioxygenase ferredoxin subunit